MAGSGAFALLHSSFCQVHISFLFFRGLGGFKWSAVVVSGSLLPYSPSSPSQKEKKPALLFWKSKDGGNTFVFFFPPSTTQSYSWIESTYFFVSLLLNLIENGSMLSYRPKCYMWRVSCQDAQNNKDFHVFNDVADDKRCTSSILSRLTGAWIWSVTRDGWQFLCMLL